MFFKLCLSFFFYCLYICCLCVCVFSVWISWALSSMLEFSSSIRQAKGILYPCQPYHWWVSVRMILCISVFYAAVFMLKEIGFYSGIQFLHYLLQFSEKSLSINFFREKLCVCVCVYSHWWKITWHFEYSHGIRIVEDCHICSSSNTPQLLVSFNIPNQSWLNLL